MHTSTLLSPGDFTLALAGREATIDDVLPGFARDARVGIVSRTPGGPFGAATALLALVTRWYDERRRQAAGAGFYEYPDYYLLQVGGEHADLGMLEVWPPRKQIVVEPGAEQLLGAIGDLALGYLLIEDHAPLPAEDALRETRAALPRHLRAALAYSPGGRVERADVAISGSEQSEQLVEQAIARSPAAVREACLAARRDLHRDGTPVEELRRVDPFVALGVT